PQLSTLNQRAGELALRLAVSGATIEQTSEGVQLVLENSGCKIAYSCLRVIDANGKELTVWMEVPQSPKPRKGGLFIDDANFSKTSFCFSAALIGSKVADLGSGSVCEREPALAALPKNKNKSEGGPSIYKQATPTGFEDHAPN